MLSQALNFAPAQMHACALPTTPPPPTPPLTPAPVPRPVGLVGSDQARADQVLSGVHRASPKRLPGLSRQCVRRPAARRPTAHRPPPTAHPQTLRPGPPPASLRPLRLPGPEPGPNPDPEVLSRPHKGQPHFGGCGSRYRSNPPSGEHGSPTCTKSGTTPNWMPEARRRPPKLDARGPAPARHPL
jgi:hypothetical protein